MMGTCTVKKSSAKTPRSRQFFGGESTSAASFDPAKELGVQDPVGFWDPLGLSADKDEATFKRRRAVEIKHGRIATGLNFRALFMLPRHGLWCGCVWGKHLGFGRGAQ